MILIVFPDSVGMSFSLKYTVYIQFYFILTNNFAVSFCHF